jgi:hypothetical protein
VNTTEALLKGILAMGERPFRPRRQEGGLTTADDICQKLDILIKLQAVALTAPMSSTKDKILFLSEAGLRPTLIAEILGTTANHVNVALSKGRKPSKGK